MAKRKYTEDFPQLAEMYAREGMIEADIAKKLGVSSVTFEDYKNKYPKFLNALKRGKAPIDFEVENSLLKRAMGYDIEETHKEIVINEKGEPEVKSIKTVKKHIPPDTTAIIFWLKNRMKARWRENSNIDLDLKGVRSIIVHDNDMAKKLEELEKQGLNEMK